MEVVDILGSFYKGNGRIFVQGIDYTKLTWNFLTKQKKIISEFVEKSSREDKELSNAFIEIIIRTELTLYMNEDVDYLSLIEYKYEEIDNSECFSFFKCLVKENNEVQKVIENVFNMLNKNEVRIYSNCIGNEDNELIIQNTNLKISTTEGNPCIIFIDNTKLLFIWVDNYYLS